MIDISPPVRAASAVFPGDTPFARKVAMDMACGAHLTLSSIETTLHIGAHADAPSHFAAAGAPIDRVDPRVYLGPCQVFDVRGRGGPRISAADLLASLAEAPCEPDATSPEFAAASSKEGIDEGAGRARVRLGDALCTPRVLLRTDSFPDPDVWRDDFRAIAPALIDSLADAGVGLVGIDTPSVDVADSKDLPTHARLAARGVANLEGLVLSGVAAGFYDLVAVPLRVEGADASPVRALLFPAGTVVETWAGPDSDPS